MTHSFSYFPIFFQVSCVYDVYGRHVVRSVPSRDVDRATHSGKIPYVCCENMFNVKNKENSNYHHCGNNVTQPKHILYT
jgi:hypothetical protein